MFICCIVSCGKRENNTIVTIIDGDKNISIDPIQSVDNTYFSNIFSSIEYIQIPTDSTFLIGNIDKMIVVDNHIIIMDKYISRSVFIFEKNKQKKVVIHKQGKGPGEYAALQDIFYNAVTNELGIFCNLQRKIVYYSLEGEYSREQPLNINAGKILPVQDNVAAYCEFYRNENLNQHDNYPNVTLISTNSVIQSDCFFYDVDPSVVWSSNPDFSRVDHNTIAILPDHCNTVYHINEDSIHAMFQFDFGKHNLDEQYWKKTREEGISVEEVDEFCYHEGYCETYNFRQDSSYIFVKYRHKGKHFFVFHSLITDVTINSQRLINDMDKTTLFFPKFFKNNKFYCLIESEEIALVKSYLKQNKLLPDKILDNCKEFDNPVIAVLSLKDF